MDDRSSELLRLAEESDLDISQIEELLDLLHAPPSLTRFQLVLENLRKVLQAGQKLNSLFDGFEIALSNDLVERVAKTLDVWSRNDSYSIPGWFDKSGGPRGIIKDHPEWAALIMGRDNPIRQREEFLAHLYVVLNASILQRRRQELLGSEIDVACRLMRKLANEAIPLSTAFPIGQGMSLGEYLAVLNEQPPGTLEDWAGVELLIRRVVEDKGKSRYVSGYRRVGGNVVRRVERADQDDPNPAGPAAEIHVYQSIGTKEAHDRARASGLHPGESEELQAASVIYSSSKPTAKFSLRGHVRRLSSQVKHIRSLNQRLPYRYQQLTNVELSAAAALPYELINKLKVSNRRVGQLLDDYVAVLIHLLLWLGRPLSQLLEIRICSSLDDLPKTVRGILAYVREDDAFVLSVPSSEWRRKLSDNDRLLLEKIGGASGANAESRIIVASPNNFARLINFLDKAKGELGNEKKQYLFPKSLHKGIVELLKKILSDKNREHNLRLTHLKISQAMFDEITTISSDWVDAALITGQEFTTTAVSSHYYAASGQYLQEQYHRAAVSLRDRLYQYLDVDEKKYYQFNQKAENEGDFGSKLNVKPKLVRELVKHFKHTLNQAKRTSLGVSSTHNALVAYFGVVRTPVSA